MEVLNREEFKSIELGGDALIQTVVTLTELPEGIVQREVNEMIQLSGHETESLTLDQLRVAMLNYLEEIHASMQLDENGDEISPGESCGETCNDAEMSKAPVILE
jgi:hypothetical protein